MTRFDIRISSLFAAPLLVIGVTPQRAYVTLQGDTMTVHYGFFHYELPLANVASAEPTAWPWYYGVGLRVAPGLTLGCVASTDGVVTLQFGDKQHMGSLFTALGVRFAALAVSLQQPQAFLDALQAHLSDPPEQQS